MKFIIAETGEERQVPYQNKQGIDWADEVSINNGLFADEGVYKDAERDAVVAPRDVVEYWENYFATLRSCEEELDELRNLYNCDEVDKIYNDEIGEPFDIERIVGAVNVTRGTLSKRYDTATAQLIGSYKSDLPASSFEYYEESLYKQDTGAYFLVGKGGPMTRYCKANADGSTGYGKGSFSISRPEALAWIAKYCSGMTRPDIT